MENHLACIRAWTNVAGFFKRIVEATRRPLPCSGGKRLRRGRIAGKPNKSDWHIGSRRCQNLSASWLAMMSKGWLFSTPLDAAAAVPDEVAVIGVDNDEYLCHLSIPPLTSVDVNAEQIGYEAAALLDRMMQGRKPPTKPQQLAPRRRRSPLHRCRCQ